MRESRTYGSVRGALSNERPYRDRSVPTFESTMRKVGTALRAFPPYGTYAPSTFTSRAARASASSIRFNGVAI